MKNKSKICGGFLGHELTWYQFHFFSFSFSLSHVSRRSCVPFHLPLSHRPLELAHGSNVAGLETTATFDTTTDEFIIHTPNIGATKWWIGGAASTATHCAVFAQLIVKGKKHGVKTFIVQLRDIQTFALRPGILIGDIGKKMGRDGIGEFFLPGDFPPYSRDSPPDVKHYNTLTLAPTNSVSTGR